jgi:serine/threonine protein kinase
MQVLPQSMSLSSYLEEHEKSHTKVLGGRGRMGGTSIRSCATSHGYVCDKHAPSREHVIYGKDKKGDQVVIKGNTKEDEIVALRALQHHPYHVKLEDFFWANIHSDSIIIVLERLSGDLVNLLEINGGRLYDCHAFRYLYQIVDAIKFLHALKIFHRDLAPDNILYDSRTDTVCLCDLGLVQIDQKDTCTKPVGKFLYAAPELLMTSKDKVNIFHSAKLDIWCVGCILCYMILGDMPWKKSSCEFYKYSIQTSNKILCRFSDYLPHSYLLKTNSSLHPRKHSAVFLNNILKIESLRRPTADGILCGIEAIEWTCILCNHNNSIIHKECTSCFGTPIDDEEMI